MSGESKLLSDVDNEGTTELTGKHQWLAHHIFKNYKRYSNIFSLDTLDDIKKEVVHPIDVYDKIIYSESELMFYIQHREVLPLNRKDKPLQYSQYLKYDYNGYEVSILFRNKNLNNNAWMTLTKTEMGNKSLVEPINDTESALNSLETGVPEIQSSFIPEELIDDNSDEFYDYIANLNISHKAIWKWEDTFNSEHKMVKFLTEMPKMDKDLLRREWENIEIVESKIKKLEKLNIEPKDYSSDVIDFAHRVSNFDWNCAVTPFNLATASVQSLLVKFALDCYMELSNVTITVKKNDDKFNLYKIVDKTKYKKKHKTRIGHKYDIVNIGYGIEYGKKYKDET